MNCRKCSSTNIHSGNKGFGTGRSIAGGLLLGPAGLLTGFFGSKKIVCTCLDCGYQWRPTDRTWKQLKEESKPNGWLEKQIEKMENENKQKKNESKSWMEKRIEELNRKDGK